MNLVREATDQERQAIIDAAKTTRDAVDHHAYIEVLDAWREADPSDKKLKEVLRAFLSAYAAITLAVEGFESAEDDVD